MFRTTACDVYPSVQAQSRLARRLAVVKNHAAMFGVLNTARTLLSAAIAPNYASESFDRLYGVDTGRLSLIDSQIPAEAMSEAVDYEPAHVQTLKHVFASVPVDLRTLHLIDIGCGKGRTLLVGARYPFRTITGIELSPVTSAIAMQNVERYTARDRAMCKAIFVRCANGTDFEVPDDHLLITMYNPFFGKTFETCIQHLHNAARRYPHRHMYLAYINPWHCEEWLEQSGLFTKIAHYRVFPRTWTWNLWQPVL